MLYHRVQFSDMQHTHNTRIKHYNNFSTTTIVGKYAGGSMLGVLNCYRKCMLFTVFKAWNSEEVSMEFLVKILLCDNVICIIYGRSM